MERTYNISEAAERLGLSVKTLQRWDREGKLVANRTPSNRRYYTDKQLKEIYGEGEKIMFIYYDDDFENKEEIIKKYKAKIISHYICSMEKIDGVEPAYEGIKELLPYIYEGSYLDLSKDNKLQLTYDEAMQFIDKVMETTSEEDIFYSEEPWCVIQNIIRDCTTMAIDKRLNDIKRDFMNVEVGLNHLKVHW